MNEDITRETDLTDSERRTEQWDEWREKGGDAGDALLRGVVERVVGIRVA